MCVSITRLNNAILDLVNLVIVDCVCSSGDIIKCQ